MRGSDSFPSSGKALGVVLQLSRVCILALLIWAGSFQQPQRLGTCCRCRCRGAHPPTRHHGAS